MQNKAKIHSAAVHKHKQQKQTRYTSVDPAIKLMDTLNSSTNSRHTKQRDWSTLTRARAYLQRFDQEESSDQGDSRTNQAP